MKLSDGERLIVVMLAEVMESMGLNREINPELVKTLAYNGHDWAISEEYAGLFAENEDEPEVVKETRDILWMWEIIEGAIGDLEGDQANEARQWRHAQFRGFDGNNDSHYGVAGVFVNDLKRFSEFAGRDLNSHSQASLPRYREMYAKFDAYIAEGKDPSLSFDDLKDLCS